MNLPVSLHPKALRYLTAVAQLGSVQAAAREVAISASAIDRQILLLEEELGVPLFERQPRGMRLTAAGELLMALSQPLHFGNYGGLALKLLWAAFTIVTLVVLASGMYLWVARRSGGTQNTGDDSHSWRARHSCTP